jgi:hypothetical protein
MLELANLAFIDAAASIRVDRGLYKIAHIYKNIYILEEIFVRVKHKTPKF